MSYLFHNLLHFSRLLHAAGLDVHAGRMPEAAAALSHVNVGRQSDFYFALRTLLIHRHQDLAPFDAAFRAFWRRHSDNSSGVDPNALWERPRRGAPQVEFSLRDESSTGDGAVRTLPDAVELTAPLSYSAREVSRTKDFSEFSQEELRDARTMLEALRWAPGLRLTRRWTAGAGNTANFRQMIRTNLRYGGEPLKIPTKERKQKPRPLVVLCDISGSMERYSRMLLHFMHTVAAATRRCEAFLFATRLTRITHELSSGDVDAALSKIAQQVSDWSGGTRIGEALRTFNTDWARRTLAHGAVAMIISDGWDRGDPEVLRNEIARLRRMCHRLVWLNPLLGSPDYQPLTRGMRAALPYIDDFLPVHNLESLEGLAEHLNRLKPRTMRACLQRI